MTYPLRYLLWSFIVLLWLNPAGSGVQCTPGVRAYTKHRGSLRPPSGVFGVVASVAQDSLFLASGYACLEESTQERFSPINLNREGFEQQLTRLRTAKLAVYSCNVFLPGRLKLVGPKVDEEAVLAYADAVFHRAREAGLSVVVLGSGEARKVPSGFDSSMARAQFVSIVRRMGPLAQAQGITLAMENLNRGETNFGNSLREVVALIREINHPSVRVTADIYHMLKEDESADAIREAGALLVHCHIAEEQDRARPGKYGEDFRPYFQALQQIGFQGKIMMECRWYDLNTEAGPAIRYLEEQWGKTR
jgi:sugar phosphate isomerase/epimerase